MRLWLDSKADTLGNSSPSYVRARKLSVREISFPLQDVPALHLTQNSPNPSGCAPLRNHPLRKVLILEPRCPEAAGSELSDCP